MIDAQQVADTLRLLIPGFVALKVFYWFGQRTKRADWEWALWSVLVAAPIAAAANWLAGLFGSPSSSLTKLVVDCGIANGSAKSGEDLRTALTRCVNDALAAHNADLRLLISVVLGIVGALAAVVLWRRLAKSVPRLREQAAMQAWDAVLSQPHWVQMKVGDLVYSGKVDIVADPVETEDLDIYIREPAIISGSQVIELRQTEGILVARDDIAWVQVLKPVPRSG